MSGLMAAVCCAAGGRTVQLIDESILSSTVSTPATGTATFNTSGTASGSGGSYSYPWLLSGLSSSYEIMATLQGSTTLTLGGNALGSWLALSSTRAWSYTKTGVGEATASLLIQIRPTGGSPIASCTVLFDCTVN